MSSGEKMFIAQQIVTYLPGSVFLYYDFQGSSYDYSSAAVQLRFDAKYRPDRDFNILRGIVAKTEQRLAANGLPVERELKTTYLTDRIDVNIKTKLLGRDLILSFHALPPGDNCRLVTEEVEVPATTKKITRVVCDDVALPPPGPG